MYAAVYQQCSFTGLMNLYEANYFMLRILVSRFGEINTPMVSRMPGEKDLYLYLSERSKYTETIHLTYYFIENGQRLPLPGLKIRLYHDTQQAEVIDWAGDECFGGITPKMLKALPCVKAKWQVNFFLGKWLQFCVNRGHHFTCLDYQRVSQELA